MVKYVEFDISVTCMLFLTKDFIELKFKPLGVKTSSETTSFVFLTKKIFIVKRKRNFVYRGFGYGLEFFTKMKGRQVLFNGTSAMWAP